MSEDDVDMLDGQAAARVDRDRRAPRFSWTPAYETTFFRSLCDSVHLGLRENSSFKAEAWERAAQALQESHNAYPSKSHLINKSDNARKRFRLWRGLRENPDFIYNSVDKTVTATEDAWRAHIEREPLSRALRGRPFDHEEFMEILYPDVIGSGGAPKRIMKPRRRTDGQPGDDPEMPGTGILNLQSEYSNEQTSQDSPGLARSSASQTPTGSAISSGVQTKPSAAMLPRRTTPTQPSALTPPDESANQAKKRALPATQLDGEFNTTPPSFSTKSNSVVPASASPEKKQRISALGGSVPVAVTTMSSIEHEGGTLEPMNDPPPAITLTQTPPPTAGGEPSSDPVNSLTGSRWCEMALEQFFRDFADEDMDLQIRIAEHTLVNESKALLPEQQVDPGNTTPRKPTGSIQLGGSAKFEFRPDLSRAVLEDFSPAPIEIGKAGGVRQEVSGEVESSDHSNCWTVTAYPGQWVKLLLSELHPGFPYNYDQTVSILPTDDSLEFEKLISVAAVSYADVAASGPKQTPEEAAAPQPVEVVNTESASTASLIDVDVPSVHTVPSDFLEQDVQTDTQAQRLDREAESAKVKAENAKKRTTKKARETDSWIIKQFSSLSDGSAGALAITNLAAIIGVSSYLGYKAWGLYERGNLNWKSAGVGFGILAGVGAVEAVLGRYLYKGKKGSS
ncbi:hypothetical protein QQS21_003536 [Conoideocrella luteorostrata]|uniref:Myb/SANT-like domain-containing protein n=1 Tax=Conoideocrella luteorostrata TaxID=1105319 RepID=A0AAJ0FW94_9HYPO|nr:hypothetical protein QQS21_003536 [Conoideocrella luteorostrata]